MHLAICSRMGGGGGYEARSGAGHLLLLGLGMYLSIHAIARVVRKRLLRCPVVMRNTLLTVKIR